MKKIILVLAVISLMGCTTLRYDEDLKQPYTETEMQLSGAGAIAFTVFTIITAGIINSEVK